VLRRRLAAKDIKMRGLGKKLLTLGTKVVNFLINPARVTRDSGSFQGENAMAKKRKAAKKAGKKAARKKK